MSLPSETSKNMDVAGLICAVGGFLGSMAFDVSFWMAVFIIFVAWIAGLMLGAAVSK